MDDPDPLAVGEQGTVRRHTTIGQGCEQISTRRVPASGSRQPTARPSPLARYKTKASTENGIKSVQTNADD